MSRRIFITGANAGFGSAVAYETLDRGYRVFATARDPATLDALKEAGGDRLATIELDVKQSSLVREAVIEASKCFGGIDVLHNNAGYGSMGGIEEVADADVREQMEVNFFGALSVMRAVLPLMREKRSGHILNMSSIAGLYARSGYGYYAASKFALEAVSESLADEARDLGIRVTIVEPSGFRTDFHGRSLQTSNEQLDDYAKTAGQAADGQRALDGKQAGDPVLAAKAMLDVVEMDDPPLRLALGNDAVDLARKKLDLVSADLDRMERVSRAADRPA